MKKTIASVCVALALTGCSPVETEVISTPTPKVVERNLVGLRLTGNPNNALRNMIFAYDSDGNDVPDYFESFAVLYNGWGWRIETYLESKYDRDEDGIMDVEGELNAY